MIRYLILYFVIVFCLLMYFQAGYYDHYTDFPSMIFTCSSYITKNDRYETFCKTMDSIVQYNRSALGKIVVVNEYDSDIKRLEIYSSSIAIKYPFIEFVQKNEFQKGQAKTLNMILDMVKSSAATYWIHWEETWICTEPFVEKAIKIMESQNDISQMQLTNDWRSIGTKRLHRFDGYIIIDPDILIHEQYGQLFNNAKWPLYSLRPSINRSDFYQSLGYFDESSDMWPWKFEWLYGIRWEAAGGRKAMIEPAICYRDESKHKSTYFA